MRVSIALPSVVAALGFVVPAHAVDVELSATTAAQSYDVASPWGYQLERRRLLQTVGFSLYHLQGEHLPGRPDYNVRLMGRVDADFGLGNHLPSELSNGETVFDVAGGSRFVPGVAIARFDLMYAYVEGKNLADGWLGFKAGRQYLTDALGWWSFDGGLARLSTPFFVDVEIYGGLEQRGGLPLSTHRFESQGVWRGSHESFDEPGGPRSSDYPSYQFAGHAPAFGAAIESAGPNWLHARLTYRRVYNTGEAYLGQYATPGGGYRTVDGLRLSSEKIGWAGYVNRGGVGGLKGGLAYDVYNQVFSNAYGGLEVYAGDKVTIGADADHYRPTFDADSIFNWFSHEPSTTATARVAARIIPEIQITGSGGARVWSTEGDPDSYAREQCAALGNPENCEAGAFDVTQPIDGAPLDGSPLRDLVQSQRAAEREKTTYSADGLGQLTARWLTTQGNIELRSMVQAGERGHRAGGDVSGEKLLDGGRYALGGRVSVYDFTDPRAENDHTTSFGYVLGAGFKPIDITRLGAEWEHDINARVGQRFRVLARLDLYWVR